MHTKEALTPVLLKTFKNTKALLPKEISDRLTSSDHVRNHGSYRTFYLFNVWDVHQADILHRDHFCYCLGYFGSDALKDSKNSGKTWGFHLWINTVRLYRSQKEIRRILETDARKVCPRGFAFEATERFVQAKMSFEFDRPLSQIADFLTPHYVKLIGAFHPVLLPIIDSFTQPLTKEERRKAILGKKRMYFGPSTRPKMEKVREYTRSIPASWRPKILASFNNECVHCKTPLELSTAHMDHIIPFSKGGGTALSNLQPLCELCNLKKGNRHEH
jgi:5-methylcytosine-specific restriction endonuclease McrA